MKATGMLTITWFILVASAATFAGTYSGGSGTGLDPYQIANSTDWIELTNQSDDWSRYFVLTNDIDLGSVIQLKPVAGDQNPGKAGFQGTIFQGVLDGAGHIISNGTIIQGTNNSVGLFGFAGPTSKIINLGIENITIVGGQRVGGLAGVFSYGQIQNCYVTGTVSGFDKVGGLVGSFAHGSIENCYCMGTVQGDLYIGGLTGSCIECSIHESYTLTHVEGIDIVGGLSGYLDRATLIDCHSGEMVYGNSQTGGLAGYMIEGSVENCSSTSNVQAVDHSIGGLVGFSEISTIFQCYATGTVSGDQNVGGLAGVNEEGIIRQSFSQGQVAGTGFHAGGFIGTNDQGCIKNCYSTGNISGHLYVGGFAGKNIDGQIQKCYATGMAEGNYGVVGFAITMGQVSFEACFWDTEQSGLYIGLNPDSFPDEVIPLTTAQMHINTYFSTHDWKFLGEVPVEDAVWRMCSSSVDYPRLAWEYSAYGDFSCPQGVSYSDFTLLSRCWNSSDEQGNFISACDLNHDGRIDVEDLGKFSENWLGGI